MLFNSYSFIFLFLPVSFIGMFWLSRYSQSLSALWLGLTSLIFYGAWNTHFVLLLLASISFNFFAGYSISLCRTYRKTYLLTFFIVANLALLGYFKYSNFFIESVNSLFGSHIGSLDIILPLGISFFTFTQIAFLVDVYRGIAREKNFTHYLLFVTWFPHLIAGPVLHHKQMMPQFGLASTYNINFNNVISGIAIFVIGLAKKVLIADSLAVYATPIFSAVSNGGTPMFFEAWIGTLAYTLQLYFDFSGYSDMAIGISLLFNIRLPLNFNSPYKASSIIDFWRRWHMTLSSFLKDYLYIPLGGSRKGEVRRYLNLFTTMLLGGLWHGAGWTFLIWGGLHGLYLVINHGWQELKTLFVWHKSSWLSRLSARTLTFVAVSTAWVFFRADNLSTAMRILTGMLGINGFTLPQSVEHKLASFLLIFSKLDFKFYGLLPLSNTSSLQAILLISLSLTLAFIFPNTQQIMSNYKLTEIDTIESERTILKFPSLQMMGFFIGLLFFACLSSMTSKVSEFLYFQF